MGQLQRIFIMLLLLIIRCYQLVVSPFKPVASCRFTPSCSAYAAEALQRHGIIKGGWLAVRRIMRCHPWGGHGVDEVPFCKEKHTPHL